jgi:hypothetical protein
VPKIPIAILFVVMLLSAVSVAQTPLTENFSEHAASSLSRSEADKTGWDGLKQSGLYHEAKVVLTDGESYRGEIISVNDDSLVVHSGNADHQVARTRVQSVSVRRPGHRGRNALIGLGVGAATGLGIGAYMDANCEGFCFIPAKAGAPVMFAPIGAGVGALIPTGGWHEAYRLR